ncbi:MAG: ribD [Chlamydiales bacterium]|nr:ribD [Chlamydiales bacterium]
MTAPPNPWVGCVLVKEGRAIGRGFHSRAGLPHAEAVALQDAKEKGFDPKGACCYVTLEPCNHFGRTPPCTQALIQAGVRRVVAALKDPDPKVSGQGLETLKQAGILVETGLLKEEALQSLLPYLTHRKLKRPYCVAKAAVSVDGRIAASDFSSKWISEPSARDDVQQLRAQSQAILIGAHTAKMDVPSLTVRQPNLSLKCLRVILDPKGSVPIRGPLFDPKLAPTLIVTNGAAQEAIHAYREAGIEVLAFDHLEPEQFLLSTLQNLAERGVLQLLIEGGGRTLASFLKAQMIDKLILYIGPKVIGEKGVPLFDGLDYRTLSESLPLKLQRMQAFDNTVRLDYQLANFNPSEDLDGQFTYGKRS